MSQEKNTTRVDASGAYIPVAATSTMVQPTPLGEAPIAANIVPAVRATPVVVEPVAPASGNAAIAAAKDIGAGRMPPNAAIQDVLTTARQTIEAEKSANPTLAQGQMATKLQNVIAATQEHLAEKNADEKYQRLVRDTATAAPTGKALGSQAVRAAEGPVREEFSLKLEREFFFFL